MAEPQQTSAGSNLRGLLTAFLAGDLDAEEFSRTFETAYNFETDRRALTAAEQTAFKKLFDVVVWYSPFPDERSAIPNYKSEAEIEEAASLARSEIS